MKKFSFILLITTFSFTVNAQITPIPDQWMKDSMPALIQKAKEVLSHAYMVQNSWRQPIRWLAGNGSR